MNTLGDAKLQRLLKPKSIAIFGGSWAAQVVQQCQKMGFAGELWPVHPNHEEIEGLKVYRSVDDLPAAPDASFIGVNREITVAIVEQLAARGAGGAVCFSSGYTETLAEGDQRGQALQDALVKASADMPILGPNCYGFINYFDAALLWPDQHGGRVLGPKEKGVAIIAQSSNMAINMTLQARDLAIGYIVTVGNQAKVGLSQIGLALLDDPRVTCLGLHVEGFDSISGMEQLAAKAYRLAKPIIILKVGKSQQAQSGTISHTASLAGAHGASQAFMARLGMAEVASVPIFLDALKLTHHFGVLNGNNLSAMVCSGGEASLIADLAVDKDVGFGPLPAATRKAAQAALGPKVSVANPLDFHTYIWSDKAQTTAVFRAMLAGGFDLNILIQDFPQAPLENAGWQITAQALIDAKIAAQKGAPKPFTNQPINIVMVSSLSESMPEPKLRQQYAQQGLVCIGGFEEVLIAAGASARINACWRHWDQHGLPAALLPPNIAAAKPWRLNEFEAKRRLKEYGLLTPETVKVTTTDAAIKAAQTIGFPLVAKALGFAHKTEHNAVRLNLRSESEVGHAAGELLLLSDEIMLESMITASLGELIIGVTNDPQYGLLLTIGLGGTLVELLNESVCLLLPTTDDAVRKALMGLKIAPVFDSYRGQSAWPLQAVIDAVLAVQSFALAHHAQLLELDINPLLVSAQTAIVADALILFNSEAP